MFLSWLTLFCFADAKVAIVAAADENKEEEDDERVVISAASEESVVAAVAAKSKKNNDDPDPIAVISKVHRETLPNGFYSLIYVTGSEIILFFENNCWYRQNFGTGVLRFP